MDFNFDFLRNEELKKQQTAAHQKRMAVYSFTVFMAVYIGAVVALIVYSLFLTTKSNNIKAMATQVEQEITNMKDVELMTILLSNKTTSLKEILENQKHHHQLADYFFNILPSGISVNGFSITSANELTFSGEANSLGALAVFIDNIKTKQSGLLEIQKASLGGLSMKNDKSNSGQKYTFSIVLAF